MADGKAGRPRKEGRQRVVLNLRDDVLARLKARKVVLGLDGLGEVLDEYDALVRDRDQAMLDLAEERLKAKATLEAVTRLYEDERRERLRLVGRLAGLGVKRRAKAKRQAPPRLEGPLPADLVLPPEAAEAAFRADHARGDHASAPLVGLCPLCGPPGPLR